MLGVVVTHVGKLSDELNSLRLGLMSLDTADLLYGFFNVELVDVLSELTSFQLSVIKQVLD